MPGTALDAFDVLLHSNDHIYCMREVLFLAYFIDKETEGQRLKLTWPKGDTSQDISFPESNLLSH